MAISSEPREQDLITHANSRTWLPVARRGIRRPRGGPARDRQRVSLDVTGFFKALIHREGKQPKSPSNRPTLLSARFILDNRFFENRAVGEGQGSREREDPQCPPRARQRRRVIGGIAPKPVTNPKRQLSGSAAVARSLR